MKTGIRIAVLVALVIQGWWAVRVTRFDSAFRDGVRAYHEARVDDVRVGFAAAREIHDRDALLWAWIGDVALYVYDYHAEGEIDPEWGSALLDEAWEAYAESVRRCPPYAWSWGGLSAVAARKVRLDERVNGIDISAFGKLRGGIWDPMRAIALASGTLAVKLKPFGFQELDILADVYEIAGDQVRAEDMLVRSASMMPAPSFHVWGTGRRLYGELYNAILAALEDGIANAPQFEWGMLHLEVGNFARLQADPERALEHFRSAETFARDEYQRYRAYHAQVGILETLSEFEDAVEVNRRVLATPFARPDDLRRMATLLDVLGRHEDACVAFLRSLRGRDVGARWRIRASRSCDRAGEIKLAERILREGIAIPSEDVDVARELIEFYARHDQRSTARHVLSVWMRDYPDRLEFREWSAELASGSMFVPRGIRRADPAAGPGS